MEARCLWHDTLGDDALDEGDGPLPGTTDADVVIVGAGYTGLWAAWYLLAAQRDLRVVVLEAEHIGFGASSRNGGWCSALLPISLSALASRHDRTAAVRMQEAMHDAVDEIGAFVEAEGIDCGFARAGYVMLARSRPQVARVHAHLAEMESFGFGEAHHRWLGARETEQLVRATDVLGAAYTPHCATVHPGRLVAGLARAVRRRGGLVHGRTRATAISPGIVRTPCGDVRAPVVLRALEGYTAGLPGHRRDLVPLYSLMVATEPLEDDVWEEIGLHHRPTFNDARKLLVYGQRTVDGRLAFGGRGAPYHRGSSVRPAHDTDPAIRDALVASLRELFPALRDVGITHHWGGPLGVARDWHPAVVFDRSSGLGWAGGYVGDGVAASHLAGRTLAELALGTQTPRTDLAWVGHRSRRWEPEPLRWLAVTAGLRLPASIDRHEAATGRTARMRSAVLGALTGH